MSIKTFKNLPCLMTQMPFGGIVIQDVYPSKKHCDYDLGSGHVVSA